MLFPLRCAASFTRDLVSSETCVLIKFTRVGRTSAERVEKGAGDALFVCHLKPQQMVPQFSTGNRHYAGASVLKRQAEDINGLGSPPQSNL